jgi:hypothetical protein
MRYGEHLFTDHEIETIRRLAADSQQCPTRQALARAVCTLLGWKKWDGELQIMSAKMALLRMERHGLITLPVPRHGNRNGRSIPPLTEATDPGPLWTGFRHPLPELRLALVRTPSASRLWNEYIARYHYLGYTPMAGAQLRYFIESEGQILGAFGVNSAAWKVAPRDDWIGWTPPQRIRHLPWVVNNARFLILPWIQIRYLASSALALLTRQLPHDWMERYGYRPVLMETFVERDRFAGTSYRAANWISLGVTQGRGKTDRYHQHAKPIKTLWVYPLQKNFRAVLTAPLPDEE